MCYICDGSPVAEDTRPTGPTFKTSMCDAPCSDPLCCCAACLCPCCTAFQVRRQVLDYDWTQYKCCQGYYDCCCFKAGSCCESTCPCPCLCCEAFLCQSCAISSTRMYVMDQKGLQSDPCDRRIIRCNNCVQLLACICNTLAICIEQIRPCAQILNAVSHIIYCTVQACMQAQVHFEYNDHTPSAVPQKQEMVDGSQPQSAPGSYTGKDY